ncbi:MAG: Mini-ribonuclease 3 [Christensenellales bacterium]|jgi:ribonuclease-3 family protein
MQAGINYEQLNPLQLAYIGDAVYELLVREYVLQKHRRLNSLNEAETAFVCASSQAKIFKNLLEHLSPEEKDIARRGRNASPKHRVPKAASCEEYSLATAMETVFGFLYLKKDIRRIDELFSLVIEFGGI